MFERIANFMCDRDRELHYYTKWDERDTNSRDGDGDGGADGFNMLRKDLMQILATADNPISIDLAMGRVVNAIAKTLDHQVHPATTDAIDGICFLVMQLECSEARWDAVVGVGEETCEPAVGLEALLTSWLVQKALSVSRINAERPAELHAVLSDSDSQITPQQSPPSFESHMCILYTLILALGSLQAVKSGTESPSMIPIGGEEPAIQFPKNVFGVFRDNGGLQKLREDVKLLSGVLGQSPAIRLLYECVRFVGRLSLAELTISGCANDESGARHTGAKSRKIQDSLRESGLYLQSWRYVDDCQAALRFTPELSSTLIAEDPQLQLKILKVFYVLFTHPTLVHFLYPNDLRVVLDVILREAPNLEMSQGSLRAAYLRVLGALFGQTDLREMGYKVQEVRILVEAVRMAGEGDVDETSRRVAERIALECTDILNIGVCTRNLDRPFLPRTALESPTSETPGALHRSDLEFTAADSLDVPKPGVNHAHSFHSDGTLDDPFLARSSPEIDPFRSRPPSESGSPTESNILPWELALGNHGVDPFSD
ncbi:hypothetical protein HDU93_009911 [Gonapodya sp. JEL0774]|nr:hypothetical protein HDU93_009911 [Gonapodya sp. JEL0774]